ncbi:Tubulin alpha chain [Thelohanellus kitauei]|uniref:Tubulin alpha chain n=1 Tax=Thelohanellus kitauei TaxID=669202 RepID=A0A0C2JKT5_THEKT|nr:Tubulin alpha chain [Thelohanellus kitauei]
MSCCFIYRGDVAHRDIFNSLNELKTKNKIKLCKWISTGFKVGVNASKPAIPSNFNMNPVEQSMCMISNSTTVIQPFIKTTDDFLAMFKKSAFVHWYQGEGLETGEFDEAISYMCDVIEEYNKVIEE